MAEQLDRLKAALSDRYTIERELGSGGMATVYLAQDLKHERNVALKVLKPELAAVLGADRFVQEIKTTAQLQHPHILPLFDSGEAEGFLYYVMPYIEGETLRDKLNREKQLGIEEAVQITAEVADALDYAHRHNVIHRDIKPENLLLNEGKAIVADFGIALAVRVAGGPRLTETGLSLGTPQYMSPEQAAADREVDARSDVYSLGAVTYEMLCGEPPHTGPTTPAVIAKLLTQAPTPPQVTRAGLPETVSAAVLKALAKTPADRFAAAGEFGAALKAPVEETVSEKSMVVLPFEDISPDHDNEYFADGLTEEVIADLSQVSALRVISRTSAMMYKGARKAAQDIGRELGVRYLLEGSVRKAGNNLRITAQLIDTTDDRHLWADKYAGTLDDVFDMQEKVSRSIVTALEMRLSAAEERRLSRRPTADAVLFDLYLRARNGVLQGSREGLEAAVRYCEEGLRLKGDSALLHAGLGYAHVQRVTFGFAGEDVIEQAAFHAARALELDAETAQAHLVLGLIGCLHGNHAESVQHLKRAIALEPAESDSMFWLGIEYSCVGRTAALEAVADQLAAVDPLHPYLDGLRAQAHANEGRFELAAECSERVCEQHDVTAFRFGSAFWYACAGRTDAALALLDPAVAETTDDFIAVASRFLSAALRADAPALPALLTPAFVEWARRDFWYSYCLAACYTLVGNPAQALDWLENAIDRGFAPYPYFREHDPFFQEFKGQPRFDKLMDRVKHEWERFEA